MRYPSNVDPEMHRDGLGRGRGPLRIGRQHRRTIRTAESGPRPRNPSFLRAGRFDPAPILTHWVPLAIGRRAGLGAPAWGCRQAYFRELEPRGYREGFLLDEWTVEPLSRARSVANCRKFDQFPRRFITHEGQGMMAALWRDCGGGSWFPWQAEARELPSTGAALSS